MAVVKSEPSVAAQAANCCAGCQMPIKDRFLFSVIEQNFHQDCIRCADCELSLNERCYTFEGKLYCHKDYWRRFGPKCSACREPIKPTELVQRLPKAPELVYHLSCFVCQDCKRHLQAGEQLHVIDERRLLCKRDFLHNQTSGAQKAPLALAGGGGGRLTQPPPGGQTAANQTQQQQQQNNQENQEGGERLHAQLMQQQQAQLKQQELGQVGDDSADLELDDELLDEEEQDESSQAAGDAEQARLAYAGGHFGQGASGAPGEKEPGVKQASSLAGDCSADDLVDANGKRRGPRTTIKPKQLETLRHAFEQAPKPSRSIRETLAQETGLNMRVIQVWFQNRRSKERRMKNSKGGVGRNFFRSSSRRIRVGPATGATPTAALGGPQQSLIAGGRGASGGQPQGKQERGAGAVSANQGNAASQQRDTMQHSPDLSAGTDPAQLAALGGVPGGGQAAGQGQQLASRGSHNSPSEFGGSSSGGFTYFSDSSNQGDAFASIGSANGLHQQAPQQQQAQAQQQQQQQQQAQYAPPQDLMTLESPSGGPNQAGKQQYGAPPQHLHKNTPPPQMYPAAGAGSQPSGPAGAHMMMAGAHLAPPPGQPTPPQQMQNAHHPHQLTHTHPHHQQHTHQHPHHQHPPHPQAHQQHLGPANSLMGVQSPVSSMGGINGLLAHPQGPSVVQW